MGLDINELHLTLNRLVRLLVDIPEAIQITTDFKADPLCIRIAVAEADLGKIIGKQGRTARALRTLVTCHGQKVGIPISINITASA